MDHSEIELNLLHKPTLNTKSNLSVNSDLTFDLQFMTLSPALNMAWTSLYISCIVLNKLAIQYNIIFHRKIVFNCMFQKLWTTAIGSLKCNLLKTLNREVKKKKLEYFFSLSKLKFDEYLCKGLYFWLRILCANISGGPVQVSSREERQWVYNSLTTARAFQQTLSSIS